MSTLPESVALASLVQSLLGNAGCWAQQEERFNYDNLTFSFGEGKCVPSCFTWQVFNAQLLLPVEVTTLGVWFGPRGGAVSV